MTAIQMFVLCGAFLVLTHGLIPLGMTLLALFRSPARRSISSNQQLPRLIVVLVVHNEQNRVRARVENLLACSYPDGRRSVVVVDNNSQDGTLRRLQQMQHPDLHILRLSGKRASFQTCVQRALTGSPEVRFVAIAHPYQTYRSDALEALAPHLAQSGVMAAVGLVKTHPDAARFHRGTDFYRALFNALAWAQSRCQCLAILPPGLVMARRELFEWHSEQPGYNPSSLPILAAQHRGRVVVERSAQSYLAEPIHPTRYGRTLRLVLTDILESIGNTLIPVLQHWHPTLRMAWFSFFTMILTPLVWVGLIASAVLLARQQPQFEFVQLGLLSVVGVAVLGWITNVRAPFFTQLSTYLRFNILGFAASTVYAMRATARFARFAQASWTKP
ncbi:MAG: glycosyltransferase [Verrucomicrobiales bacterium]